MESNNIFLERRSINFFDKNKKIEDSLLKEIINLAVNAPSAFNLQPWRIIAVKSDEQKKKLLALSNNQEKVMDASVNLIIIGNKEGYNDNNPVWKEMLQSVGGDETIVNGAKQVAAFLYGSSEDRKTKFAESNAGLLAMSIMYAAKTLGIESHPMSGIDFDGIHKEYNLEKGETVVMTIALGFHDATKVINQRRARRMFDEIAKIV